MDKTFYNVKSKYFFLPLVQVSMKSFKKSTQTSLRFKDFLTLHDMYPQGELCSEILIAKDKC